MKLSNFIDILKEKPYNKKFKNLKITEQMKQDRYL